MEVAACLEGLKEIIDKGGPSKSDFQQLKVLAEGLSDISLVDENKLYTLIKPILSIDSIIGHTFLKPYGYAGDFHLIDKIYNRHVSKNPVIEKWDNYYHEADSSTAVRNRKNYFLSQIKKAESGYSEPQILNLGSGPCTDVYEYFKTNPSSGVIIDCLDMDRAAIDYGSTVCDNYYQSINFINQNAFRFRPDHQYDLIWSAGLFDYFSDKLFIRLTNRMYQLLDKKGELIIGNFSTANPGKAEMEVYGKWFLNHRDEKTLIDLAISAGIPKNTIRVKQEPKGVNLFLHIKK